MSEKGIMNLYELLPSIYRIRDAKQGYKLRSLLEIISDQADIIKRDIDGLWDDFFIETCKDWVIPYIADLVANNPLNEVAARRRADVAKTIYYRRRKGTLSMLEELARDVTGWGAHVVPFFEQLGWTQNLNHLRYSITSEPVLLEPIQDPFALDRVGSVNLRNRNALNLLNGPFDIISHTVDVRAISRWEGWYNIRNIGFFLWRLRSYPMMGVKARKSSSHENCFHFSPLGNPMSLFNRPHLRLGDDGLCSEINMLGPIRPLAFYFNKNDYYVSQDEDQLNKYPKSIAIYCGPDINSTQLITIDKVMCKDLSQWSPPPQHMIAAVDLRLGRIAFTSDYDPREVYVSYSYGFSAEMGSGPYERTSSLEKAEKYDFEISVCKQVDASNNDAKCFALTLEQALIEWKESGSESAVITIADSATYEEKISIDMTKGKRLVIQSANQVRPHIRLINDSGHPGILDVKGGLASKLVLNGLLIEGGVYLDENISEFVLKHCTLVPGLSLNEDGEPTYPGSASLKASDSNKNLAIEIDHCITGPFHLPEEMAGLSIKDSIVDACNFSGNGSDAVGNGYAISSGKVVAGPDALRKTLPLMSWGEYEAIVFEGTSYFRNYSKGFVHTNSDVKGPDAGKYCSILHNDREIKYIGYDGEGRYNLILDEGYELALKSIDNNNRINLELIKDGQVIHSKELQPLVPGFTIADQTYCYRQDFGPLGNMITIAVHIQSIIGFDNDSGVLLVTDGVWQISNAPVFPIPLVHLPGPCLRLERTTVFGSLHVKELALACEVIFTGPVVANRQQEGCVRFSFLPEGSKTPRRFRCQPDLALEKRAQELHTSLTEEERDEIKRRLHPCFTSVRYGDPAYAQLSLDCAKEIQTGAEDGSEMGAFCSLMQPQREENLRIRLEEYLPFGLEAGFIYIT
jgi:hypothetical protein